MTKKSDSNSNKSDLPLEAMALEYQKDRYKLAYAALRWAREIKQKENLPDPLPLLVPRALRDIIEGKMTIKEIEKLPMIVKVAPAPQPAAPTITLSASPETHPSDSRGS